MNKSEKKLLSLMLVLFLTGVAVRYVPVSLPEIEQLPVEFKQEISREPVADEALSIENTEAIDSVPPSSFQKEKPKSSPKAKKPKGPVAINSASANRLCGIPGVGPKLAEKIIEYRNARGPIKNEKDLQKIPGIGKKKSESMIKNIIFD